MAISTCSSICWLICADVSKNWQKDKQQSWCSVSGRDRPENPSDTRIFLLSKLARECVIEPESDLLDICKRKRSLQVLLAENCLPFYLIPHIHFISHPNWPWSKITTCQQSDRVIIGQYVNRVSPSLLIIRARPIFWWLIELRYSEPAAGTLWTLATSNFICINRAAFFHSGKLTSGTATMRPNCIICNSNNQLLPLAILWVQLGNRHFYSDECFFFLFFAKYRFGDKWCRRVLGETHPPIQRARKWSHL